MVLAGDIYTNVYTLEQSYTPLSILTVYLLVILFILRSVIKTDNKKIGLNKFYDFIYLTLEIFAVYFTILTFPNVHDANIYFNSLKGFWFVLVAIGSFSGNWYYSIYTGILVAILNATFYFFYDSIYKELMLKDIDFTKIIPPIQVFVLSIYYIMTGAFIALPFYLFKINKTWIINAKIDNIVAKPYNELSLPDGDTLAGNYLITKITTSLDIVGADYVSLRQVKKNSANLVIGDTIGHGLNRSPGAIIAMSAFQSYNGEDVIEIQNSINRVLFKIDKETGGKTYCLSLNLKNTGVIEYSGKVESLRIIRKNKQKSLKRIEVETHGEILGISEKLSHTKKNTMYLNIDDMLIIQTDGVVFNNEHDDKTIVMITRKY